jgi:Endosomal/lysosomal potassium channel TMEM175
MFHPAEAMAAIVGALGILITQETGAHGPSPPMRMGAMRTSRLEAFSDGVLAIIITIMVLELKVPRATASTTS